MANTDKILSELSEEFNNNQFFIQTGGGIMPPENYQNKLFQPLKTSLLNTQSAEICDTARIYSH